MKKLLNPKSLDEAKKNTTVAVKSCDGNNTVKQGIPNDHSRKHDADGHVDRVGINIGVTKSMDNYESLRVDVWYTSNVNEGETIDQAYDRIKEVTEKVLTDTVAEYIE